jgi:predicted AAA+ superfamily ATPase
MSELGERRGTVVTRDEEELVEVEGGTIEIVPAWRFLLTLDETA